MAMGTPTRSRREELLPRGAGVVPAGGVTRLGSSYSIGFLRLWKASPSLTEKAMRPHSPSPFNSATTALR